MIEIIAIYYSECRRLLTFARSSPLCLSLKAICRSENNITPDHNTSLENYIVPLKQISCLRSMDVREMYHNNLVHAKVSNF